MPEIEQLTALSKRLQMKVNSLAERADMHPDNLDYRQYSDALNKVNRSLDEHHSALRETDAGGKLTAEAPSVSPNAAGDPNSSNFHFEPSVAEARRALSSDPALTQRLGLTQWATGIAKPETVEPLTDPTSGAPQGQGVNPSQTFLDTMDENASAYKSYAEDLWQRKMAEAQSKGEGIQRYKNVKLKDQPLKYLTGGAEYNIDRRLAPAALGAADSVSMGQASPLYDATRDLTEYELGKRGVNTDFLPPKSEEVISRSPGMYLAGNIAGYGAGFNPTNMAAEGALGAANYAGRGMLGKAGVSAAVGAGVNTAEGAVGDFSRSLGQGKGIGEAAGDAAQNMPLNFIAGGLGGGVIDAAGQAIGLARQSYRDQSRLQHLKVLEAAGGGTHPAWGIEGSPEMNEFVRQSNEPGAVGSPGDRAARAVAPDIEASLATQATGEQQKIRGQMDEYFNHPGYNKMEASSKPMVDAMVEMAKQGRFNAPLSQAPRNIDPSKVKTIGRELSNFAEVKFVPREQAAAAAEAAGGSIIDTDLARELFSAGDGSDIPAGSVAIAVGKPLTAKLLTELEERIYNQLGISNRSSGNADPVYTTMDRAAKEMRDQFPYYVDENNKLISPPQEPVQGHFDDSTPPGSGGDEGGGGPPPPAGPGLPPGGAPPALPEGSPPALGQSNETPISMLAGNKLAMPEGPSAPTERLLPPGQHGESQFDANSQPPPNAKDWTDSEKELGQWYDNIVAPGKDARSDDAKRAGDLYAQEQASRGPNHALTAAGAIGIGAGAALAADDDKNGAAAASAAGLGLLLRGHGVSPNLRRFAEAVQHDFGPELLNNPRVTRAIAADARLPVHELSPEDISKVESALGAPPRRQPNTEQAPYPRPEGRLAEADLPTVSAPNAQGGPRSTGPSNELMRGLISRAREPNSGMDPAARRFLRDFDFLGNTQSIHADTTKDLRAFVDNGNIPRETADTIHQAIDAMTRRTPTDNTAAVARAAAPRLVEQSGLGKVLEDKGHIIEKYNGDLGPVIKKVLPNADAETIDKILPLDTLKAIGNEGVKSVVSAASGRAIHWTALGMDAKDANKPAWQISRSIRRKPDGELVVHHDLFKIRDDLKGKGHGEKVLHDQMEGYAKAGVDKVEVDSAWDGRYYWPSLGFNNPDAVPEAVNAYKGYLKKEKGFSEASATQAAQGIGSLPSLANAEHGKDFFLNTHGEWNSNLSMVPKESNPLFQFMKKRLNIMIGAGVGLYGALDDDESNDNGTAAMAAVIGGGGHFNSKEGRQLEALLDDGTKVQGFSALRRQQHTEQEAIELAKKRVGAGRDQSVEDRVRTFNQSPGRMGTDETLLSEAQKIGKEKELRTAAGTSVYPSLKDMSHFGGNQGPFKGAIDFFGLRGEKLAELMSGSPRNPFAREPNTPAGSIQKMFLEDPARRLLNLTGGRPGARFGDDFRKIYEEFQRQKDERDKKRDQAP